MTRTLQISPKTKDILSYESLVWDSADILRGSVTTKEHLYPAYMMPFFALIMVESRLVREYAKVAKDVELISEEDRIIEIKETTGFYNSMIIEEKITLKDLVANDKHFFTEFDRYLKSFDGELQSLLGVIGGSDTENLNIASKVSQLKDKGVLLSWIAKWAAIDFTPYDNSEITTLEEHIKRKWADMSADTAGQQYTPTDIIDLICELILVSKIDKNKIIKIYDMTCGGGNMLFGVEDKLVRHHNDIKTATYGQEMEGSLYALARIESKFRQESRIEKGNTLTNDKLAGEEFDFIVANPPYGVDWKDYQKAIENDQSGRFSAGKPAVSDGQLLFVQHALSKLNDNGKAFIVLNGSPLFSGGASSGESNIRKWIMDNDYLEGLIQLPTDEFFNTGITTYIWCLNKNKPAERKDKIIFINAAELFKKLKKSKGKKSKEIPDENRKNIAQKYLDYQESNIVKIKSKFDFYFNKQAIKKLEKDDKFGAFNNGVDLLVLKGVNTINLVSRNSDAIGFCRISNNSTGDLKKHAASINELAKNYNNEEQSVIVICDDGIVYSLDENNCILKTTKDKIENFGYGQINFKAKHIASKTTKNGNIAESIQLDVSVGPVWTKDEETIQYAEDEETNQAKIKAELLKWVSPNEEDFNLLENSVGTEINFNNIFPKIFNIRTTDAILREIAALDLEIRNVK